MYNRMGLYKNLLPAMGVIQENVFNADLYTKGCPWVTQGQKQEIEKKIHFAFAVKNVGLYTRGGGYTSGITVPQNLVDKTPNK